MAKHRSHSIEFKRQVAQEFVAGCLNRANRCREQMQQQPYPRRRGQTPQFFGMTRGEE